MQKILIFDMDQTLFDRDVFLSKFIRQVSEKLGKAEEEIGDLVFLAGEGVKKQQGYLHLESLIISLSAKLEISQDEVRRILLDPEHFKDSFYKDVDEVLLNLSGRYPLALFSKGDSSFQGIKAQMLGRYFHTDFVHIFANKIDNFPSLLEKYKEKEIVLIDDSLEVLKKAKELNQKIFTILIERNKREHTQETADFIDKKIYNLKEILDIL